MNKSDISRIIEMAWEDRTPFEAIEATYNLSEKELKDLMKKVNGQSDLISSLMKTLVSNDDFKSRVKRHTSHQNNQNCGAVWCSVVQCGAVWCSVVQNLFYIFN